MRQTGSFVGPEKVTPAGCAPPFSSREATRTTQHRRPPFSKKARTAYAKKPTPVKLPKCAWNWRHDSMGTGVSSGPRVAMPTNPATSVRKAVI